LGFDERMPKVDYTAWIAPTATLIGDVLIEANSSVFYGAVVRADRDRVVIGAGSNLQDNVVVHTDPGSPTILGSGVSVGHGAIVHGCQIEDDSLIGMGATVMNRAVVARECLVAAGALVPEGMIIPPRSLVAGVPGRVRRELSDDEVAGIRRNAEIYRELSRKHREQISAQVVG